MIKTNHKNILFTVRVLFILLALSIVAVLMLNDIVPSGKWHKSTQFLRPSAFFSDLVPLQRTGLSEAGYRQIIDEPVYTTFNYPRPFKTLTVLVKFSNPGQLLIEAGPQNAAFAEAFSLRPLFHPLLNQLAQESAWSLQTFDSATLYQRRSQYQYKTQEQLVVAAPPQQNTAYYGVDWAQPYLPSFDRAVNQSEVNLPLRGSHEFLLATGNNKLDVSIEYVDINKQAGADGLTLVISNWDKQVLAQYPIEDDGDATESGRSSNVQTISRSLELNQVPGVYRFGVSTTSDIVIEHLKINAPYLVANGSISIAGEPDYTKRSSTDFEATIVSSARTFSASTSNRATLQAISVGNELLNLQVPLQSYTYNFPLTRSFSLDTGYSIRLDKPNILIVGRGVFAFDQQSYFSPYPWYLEANLQLDSFPINYIYSSYVPPKTLENGDYEQEIHVNLAEVYAPDQKLRVKISIPQLDGSNAVEIKKMDAYYESDALTFQNASEKFKRFVKRITN